ncbi:MAG TPA: hypothetical protein ENN40_00455 [Candidatus Aminicenantes bacterium]|nr:hypothetical protein [Candidatus Aminicenantes bacterium]
MKRTRIFALIWMMAMTLVVNAGTVPFRLVGHIIVVECRLDDNDTRLNFVVDTAGRTFVDPETAKKLNLKTKGFGVKISKLKMGDMVVGNVFGLMGFDFSPWKKHGIHLSGMIGSDLLERFTVTFDYPARHIDFSNARELDPALPGLRQKFSSHPINNAPMVPLKIGDLPEIQAMIDTGQPMGLVLPLSMWKDVRPQGKVVRARGVLLKWPMTHSRENRLTRQHDVRVGPLPTETVPVFWAELPAALSVPLLGRDFLSRYRITLCYPAREILFQPLVDKVPDSSASTFGFFVYWDEESGHARLRGIWQGSPADVAGLEPEDKVLSIWGNPVNFADFPDMLNRLEDPEVREVEMEVERDGRRRTLHLERRPLFQPLDQATEA